MEGSGMWFSYHITIFPKVSQICCKGLNIRRPCRIIHTTRILSFKKIIKVVVSRDLKLSFLMMQSGSSTPQKRLIWDAKTSRYILLCRHSIHIVNFQWYYNTVHNTVAPNKNSRNYPKWSISRMFGWTVTYATLSPGEYPSRICLVLNFDLWMKRIWPQYCWVQNASIWLHEG